MFGLSFAEIAVIVVVAVVVFGPDKLPELARTVGKSYREMRRLTNSIREAIVFEDPNEPKQTSLRYIVEKTNHESEGVDLIKAEEAPSDNNNASMSIFAVRLPSSSSSPKSKEGVEIGELEARLFHDGGISVLLQASSPMEIPRAVSLAHD